MHFFPLQDRRSIPELMDAPDVDPPEHRRALAGLRRINRVSGIIPSIARPLLAHVRRTGKREFQLLDIACGGGDVPVGVAAFMRTRGITLLLTLSDKSDTAIGQAVALARSHNIPAVGIPGEAPDTLPQGAFDIVTNTLFLHHLSANQVTQTLAAMKTRLAPGGILVISDLRRSLAGYLIAWLGTRALSRSRIVHYDGPISVQAAWTIPEMREMAKLAGLTGAAIRRAWPWRMQLIWHNVL
jgi:2-polyprenyl-3-methyl-5-hydroxy-6-metoxy-1,4-benzoquinol methylase